MSKEKWQTVQHKDGLYISDKKKKHICTVAFSMMTPKDVQNAELIAKAPEMRDLLIETHIMFDKLQYPTEREMYDMKKRIESLVLNLNEYTTA